MNRYLNRGAETRLSRLPKLSNTAANAAIKCGACDGAIEAGNEFLQSVRLCRKCLDTYAKIDSLLDAAAIEKTKNEKLLLWGTK